MKKISIIRWVFKLRLYIYIFMSILFLMKGIYCLCLSLSRGCGRLVETEVLPLVGTAHCDTSNDAVFMPLLPL